MPLSPQSDNMLLIARDQGGRGRGEGAKKVSRTSHCRYAARSLSIVPEASRYMRKALRRRRRRTTAMRRDEYGGLVGRSGEIDFFNQGRPRDRSQSKRNGSKNEIDDGRMYSNQFGRFLADQESTLLFRISLDLGISQGV